MIARMLFDEPQVGDQQVVRHQARVEEEGEQDEGGDEVAARQRARRERVGQRHRERPG